VTRPNPGDFAVVIEDPNKVDGHSNVGKKVHCGEWEVPSCYEDVLVEALFGQLISITTLETFWGVDRLGDTTKRVQIAPGVSSIVPVCLLKRIDPPDSGEELYKAEPTPSERYREVLRNERQQRLNKAKEKA